MAQKLTYIEDDVEWYTLKQIERDYIEHDLPKVRQGLKEFVAEFPEKERFEMRRRYILSQLQELKKTPNDPRLPKVIREIKIFTGRLKGISPELVAKAREYKISDLIKTTRGMAICPFHQDKSPSLDVRKNFYHCYGCGAHGDVIDLAMKTKGLTFTQAITYLT